MENDLKKFLDSCSYDFDWDSFITPPELEDSFEREQCNRTAL
jgi:hypothetical protein